MNKRLHLSWHIAIASAGILSGAVLARLLHPIGLEHAAWLVVAGLLLVLALTKRTRQLLLLAFFGGLLIGIWRGSAELLELTKYQAYYNRPVLLEGRTAEDPVIGNNGKKQLRLTDVRIADDRLHGQVWVSTYDKQDIKRGDIVRVGGELREGFGTFAASMNRAEVERALRPEPGDIGRRVRDWFAAKVRIAIAEPQASLGVSYTLGQSQGLSDIVNDEFRLLGLTHLLVASGSQLTLLVCFARRPLSRVSKYLAAATALALIGGFLLMTGLSPSMVRAALVSGLSLLAWYYGRNIHPVVLLLFVAGLTVLMQPSFIWGDVGWLLSFAAFGGIVILAPLINHYFWGSESSPGFLRYLLVSTVAAQIVTLPIAIYVFGEYSPLSVIANALILPLVSLVMLFVLLSGLAGAIIPGLAGLVGWPAQVILTYMTSATSALATLPWAHGEVKFSVFALAASYAAIVILVIFFRLKTGHNFRRQDSYV